jgi:rod shape determining protein RodA
MLKEFALKFRKEDFDWYLVGTALILSGIGIILIYSAKHYDPNPFIRGYYLKQVFWLVLSIFSCFILFLVPIRLHEVFVSVYYVIGIALLVAVLAFGSAKMGAARWFSFGSFNLQPSEFAKIATLMALARYLSYTKRSFYNLRFLTSVFLLALLPALLILKQPDLGTSLVFMAILISLLFWKGLSLWQIVLFVSPFLSLIFAFHYISFAIFFLILVGILYYLRPHFLFTTLMLLLNLGFGIITPLAWNHLHDYQKMRIVVFLDPGKDPQKAGYQIIQSKIAVGSGGVLGKGFLKGTQTKLAFLPEQHTDFVFAVLGEEFGFWGALVLLGLFCFLFIRGVTIARKCRNSFASFVALGLASVFAFQMLINIGMVVGLMPVTGLPLPFVSYGGSSLVTSWAMIGILLSINHKWYEY